MNPIRYAELACGCVVQVADAQPTDQMFCTRHQHMSNVIDPDITDNTFDNDDFDINEGDLEYDFSAYEVMSDQACPNCDETGHLYKDSSFACGFCGYTYA